MSFLGSDFDNRGPRFTEPHPIGHLVATLERLGYDVQQIPTTRHFELRHASLPFPIRVRYSHAYDAGRKLLAGVPATIPDSEIPSW